ncbi:glutathione synthase [Acrasis kona]|uniref:Glutathione synthetase n=1 Tax=Acrasis kona TaxID=1008807 RepID=A0AAW2YTD9_9EUKA
MSQYRFDEDNISYEAQTYATCNGLVMRSKPTPESDPKCVTVEHVAFTLHPHSYPRKAYEDVVEASPLLNSVVDGMSRDPSFLVESLKGTAQADDFTGKLLDIYKRTFESNKNKYAMAVHRSDYMLHHDTEKNEHIPQQVELNTISSAFLSLSTLTHDLHQYLSSPSEKKSGEWIRSTSKDTVPKLFAKAHEVFGEKGQVILFVVQANERNYADQKHLQHALWEKYQIPVVRKTLSELSKLSDQKKLLCDGNIVIEGRVVSVVYFRAGYTPDDYPTQSEWNARYEVEASSAIKCPNIGHHLVGAKKIQQVMADQKVLSKFSNQHEKIFKLFTGLYGLESTLDQSTIQHAIQHPELYVLKPQREGGGNLIHGQRMQALLKEELDKDLARDKYILMKRIKPQSFQSRIMRSGVTKDVECVAELGTFGLYLHNGVDQEAVVNECGGYLLRTKAAHDEDGGVASGIASMDSLCLI